MSNTTSYTRIESGDKATPGTFNSRFSTLHLNIDQLNVDKIEGVQTSNISDGAVTNAKLATNAVTNSKVLDGTLVASTKLNQNSLNFSRVTIQNLELGNGATSRIKLTYNSGALNYDVKDVSNGITGSFNLVSSRDLRPSLRASSAPASGTSRGSAGELAFDTSYIYVCVSTNSWRRAALSAF